ncbi:AraC family transcriptional regulator [Neobacillus cucumis]|uniref:AraC family transcriptional regulator n=1 Tax=Neobacillus cucumis TaxID=1740721 RepID=UPI00203E646D|nr:AraC family transcriptional regulator [Neobacillus cucumis]MCM3724764.1 AraC family transcriptional regulator [Neobacillus cucumis]
MKLRCSEFMEVKEFPFCIRRYIHDHFNTPPVHSHEFIELIYVVQGEAEHIFEGQSYKIYSNDVFIINPGEVHTFSVEEGKTIEIINCLFLPNLIQGSWLKELGVSQSMDYFYIHPFLNKNERFHHGLNLKGNYSIRFLAQLEKMIQEFEKGSSISSVLIRLQLVELLILLSQIYNEKRTIPGIAYNVDHERKILIQRICGYLERHYDQKISIPDLCQLFNISARHLNRLFKQETNETVVEMIQRIRIEKAKYLLLASDEKVINIAMRVGYDDPAFFSKLFRRVVGCSPGKYKAQSADESFQRRVVL